MATRSNLDGRAHRVKRAAKEPPQVAGRFVHGFVFVLGSWGPSKSFVNNNYNLYL